MLTVLLLPQLMLASYLMPVCHTFIEADAHCILCFHNWSFLLILCPCVKHLHRNFRQVVLCSVTEHPWTIGCNVFSERHWPLTIDQQLSDFERVYFSEMYLASSSSIPLRVYSPLAMTFIFSVVGHCIWFLLFRPLNFSASNAAQ